MSATTASATVVTLPVVRDVPVPGLAALLDAVREMAEEHVDDQHVEQAAELSWEDEFAAQDLALAGESANLRARADRFATAVECGATVEGETIQDVLRAFRSYHPLLGARDRRLNAAAYRRLSDATAPAPHQAA